jgi:hypothetical protein
VVPAHTALQVASHFISVFQERTKELQRAWVERGNLRPPFAPEGLTTSAGVVLAHAFYPASQLMDLAGDLLKFAKRKVADLAKKKYIEGSLDFMVLHPPVVKGSKSGARTNKPVLINGRTILPAGRPYTATETFEFLERVSVLKKPY